ncbi:hypothetical protein BIW11_05500 [Tropilaelaps mercedesae]|uniref:VPS9 domain-containing protein n=1 Tax=Tropilaelaps mercedesae TaxID=418985 RepID=A0A1V9Y260_9ACAR|nr:hypothetical protein BIW11_05500 [Tropilaelaps mercedesae]
MDADFQKRFEAELKCALRRRWMVLVPVDGSFPADNVDTAFVDYHIVRPSALYADHFEACCKTPTKRRNSTSAIRKPLIKWDKEKNILITSSGFPHVKQVRVLANELAYNESLQTYTILLISEPLHSVPKSSKQESPTGHAGGQSQCYRNDMLGNCRSRDDRRGGTMDDLTGLSEDAPAPLSHQEARTYLLSQSILAPTLRVIDEKVDYFNNTYVILPNFINDTVDKLKSISDTAIQVLTCNTSSDEAQLSSCIDNYVSGLAHHKVFGSVKSFCRIADADLERRLEFLRSSHVTVQALGVREETFHCELPQAIVELASLDSKYTPIDKLWCLRSTLRLVRLEVEEHARQSGAQLYYANEVPALTCDVLIPLVVLVMARSRPTHFASNIYYIDHFCGVKNDFSSFTITTFKAAIEFVRNFNGHGLEQGLSPRMLKKELSLVDLMEVTATINGSNNSSSSLTAEPKIDDEAEDESDEDSAAWGIEQQFLPQEGAQQQPQPQAEQSQGLQQSPLQRKSLVRNCQLRSLLGRVSSAGASGLSGGSAIGVDRKLEKITRLIEQQTLDFHSKEEEHLRRLDNNHSSKSSMCRSPYEPFPSSSSLNSSSNRRLSPACKCASTEQAGVRRQPKLPTVVGSISQLRYLKQVNLMAECSDEDDTWLRL